jgi:quinolinate synthase
MQALPTLQTAGTQLPLAGAENVPELSRQVRELAADRNAVILAHNYQVPEVQDVADYVGDSLGLSQQAASTDADVIVFAGVHFMAETAAILAPDKTVLIPDLEAGCSLAASIDADALRRWKDENPDAVVVSYVNTTAEVKALSDYCCTSGNAQKVIEAVPENRDILFLPDMFLGSYLERITGRKMKIWPGECHVHAGIRPSDITAMRTAHPGADFLIHPECGCSTSVMEYMAAGDLDPEGVHMLSTGGMLDHVKSNPDGAFIVATENGMLHPLRQASPTANLIEANRMAVCKYMKMTTLPKLRDSLRDLEYEVSVPTEISELARIPIERMVSIG